MKALFKKFTACIVSLVLITSQITLVFSIPTDQVTRISVHTQSEGNASTSVMNMDKNGNAKVAWLESPQGNPAVKDIFYFDTAHNTTGHISGNSLINNLYQVVTDDNVSHIVWKDYNNTAEGTDLYYFNTSTQTKVDISDSSLTSGDVADNNINVIFNGNIVYVSWAEATSTSSTDMFLYNTSTQTTTHISHATMNMGDVAMSKLDVDDSGVVHVIWTEETTWTLEDMIYSQFNIFYYNSEVGNTSVLTGSTQPNVVVIPTSIQYLFDSNNKIHVTWNEMVSGASDLYYYDGPTDSVTMLTDDTTTDGWVGASTIKITSDNTVYVAWDEERITPSEGSDVFIFDTISGLTTDLSQLNPDTINNVEYLSLEINTDNHPYVIWTENTNIGFEGTDIFLADLNTNTVTDISNHSDTEGEVGNFSTSFDSAGELYIAFSERSGTLELTDMFLYSTVDSTTRLITNRAITEGDVETSSNLTIEFDSSDNPFIVWIETSSNVSEDTNLYAYDGGTRTTYSLSDLSSVVEGNVLITVDQPETSRSPYVYSDISGRIDVIWIESKGGSTAEGSNLFYYNTDTNTTVEITGEMITEGDISSLRYMTDYQGHLQIFWTETSQDSSEGLDLFHYNGRTGTTELVSDDWMTKADVDSIVNNYLKTGSYKGRTFYVSWAENDQGTEGKDMLMWRTDLTPEPPGYVVSPVSPDTTMMEGTINSTSYNVVLTEQPLSNVVVSVTSADPAIIRVDTPTLTFTPFNWDTPQNVSITAMEDGNTINEQDIALTFSINDALSNDYWDNFADEVRNIDVIDNDIPIGFTVTPSTDTNITEGSTNATAYTVTLNQPIDNDLSIFITSSDPAVVVDNPNLIFTSRAWSRSQTVSITAPEDSNTISEQNVALTFVADAVGNPTEIRYVNISDNDAAPGYVLSPTAPDLSIVEGASNAAAYNLKLTMQPTSNVVVSVSSANPAVVVNTPALTFTNANWNTLQNVSITAPEDSNTTSEQDVALTFSINDALSDDAWDSLADETRNVDVTDNDLPNYVISPTSPDAVITEGNTNSSAYNVVLSSQPASNVVITVSSTNSAVTVNTQILTFTNSNWNTPQNVSITAAEDSNSVNEQDVTLIFSINDALSNDAWDSLPDTTRNVDVLDNDVAGYLVSPSTDVVITEGANNNAAYNVVLSNQPGSNVVISVTSGNPAIVVNTPSLTFTTANWNTAQNVSITAAQDSNTISEQNIVLTFSINDALSDDSWDSLADTIRNVDVTDNDSSSHHHSSGGSSTVVTEVPTPTSTPTPLPTPVLPAICSQEIYLTKPVQYGAKNNPADVKMLETFLNTYEDANLTVDGVYSVSDLNAVRKWQEKYAEDILYPWGLTKGTGFVYTLSLKKIKEIIDLKCPVQQTLSCSRTVSFTKPVEYGWNNSYRDVRLVEQFLNTYENANIKVDGYYNYSDRALIIKWQEKYAKDILTPFGLKRGTGYIFTNSMRKMKEIHENACKVE